MRGGAGRSKEGLRVGGREIMESERGIEGME